MQRTLGGETRDILVWLCAITHATYHQKGTDMDVPWRSCEHEYCQRVVKFLDDTATVDPNAEEPRSITSINVGSIYGMMSHRGLVVIEMGGVTAQISPAEAREHALNILQAVEAAITDEFLIDTFKDVLGLPEQQAGALLGVFRESRKEKADG